MIDITPYVKESKRHTYYARSVDRYDDLRTHANGEYAKKLIEERRPAESPIIKSYREKIAIANTKGYFNRVIASLQKIRKSFDYSIQFDEDDVPNNVAEKETLQSYTVHAFPKFTSLDNWFWSVCFKQQLTDSNAVSLVNVVNQMRTDNEYAKPYPTVFNSDQIYDYKESEFYFLKSNEAYTYTEKKTVFEGKVFYHVTATNIDRYYQLNSKEQYGVDEFVHGLGYLPIVKLQGVIESDNQNNSLCNSRLEPVIPFMKEAVREYSDLQAEVVQHIHSTMWSINSNECKRCKGIGIVKGKGAGARDEECSTCHGKGFYPFDPYSHFSIKQPEAGANMPPTPPAGYITKSTEIVKIQAERVKSHIYEALSAINYEWLMSTPLNQSGTAKEVDRSELNNFVYSVAEDAIRVIDEHFKIICDYRYSVVVKSADDRLKMLPTIEVPLKYDIITDTMISADLKAMREAKMNGKIIAAAEVEYVGKRFQTDPQLKEETLAIFLLDPLSGASEDELTIQLINQGISRRDYIVHCNIRKFVDRAVFESQSTKGTTTSEKTEFLNLPYDKQMEILYGYADDTIKEYSGVAQVKASLSASARETGQ